MSYRGEWNQPRGAIIETDVSAVEPLSIVKLTAAEWGRMKREEGASDGESNGIPFYQDQPMNLVVKAIRRVNMPTTVDVEQTNVKLSGDEDSGLNEVVVESEVIEETVGSQPYCVVLARMQKAESYQVYIQPGSNLPVSGFAKSATADAADNEKVVEASGRDASVVTKLMDDAKQAVAEVESAIVEGFGVAFREALVAGAAGAQEKLAEVAAEKAAAMLDEVIGKITS